MHDVQDEFVEHMEGKEAEAGGGKGDTERRVGRAAGSIDTLGTTAGGNRRGSRHAVGFKR